MEDTSFRQKSPYWKWKMGCHIMEVKFRFRMCWPNTLVNFQQVDMKGGSFTKTHHTSICTQKVVCSKQKEEGRVDIHMTMTPTPPNKQKLMLANVCGPENLFPEPKYGVLRHTAPFPGELCEPDVSYLEPGYRSCSAIYLLITAWESCTELMGNITKTPL